jgi:hypothetical protein
MEEHGRQTEALEEPTAGKKKTLDLLMRHFKGVPCSGNVSTRPNSAQNPAHRGKEDNLNLLIDKSY